MSAGRSKRLRTDPAADARVALGRIDKLVLENFKSWDGHHEIGPFEKFTCIIGPNGSGKSNLMDAISFCLGVRAKHLRSDRLLDLIHRKEGQRKDKNTRTAKVHILFRTAQGSITLFGRTISPKGVSGYLCGPADAPRHVNYEDFEKALAAEHIYVRSKNFLVFQGDIMDLARRQAAELTATLEVISGSGQLKQTYDRLSRELELAQDTARVSFQNCREIDFFLAEMEKEHGDVRRFEDLRQQRDEVVLERVLFKLFARQLQVSRSREARAQVQGALAAADSEMQVLMERGKANEAERRRRAKAEAEATAQAAMLKASVEQGKKTLVSLHRDVHVCTQQLQEKETSIKSESARLRSLEARRAEVRQAQDRCRLALRENEAKKAVRSVLDSLTAMQRLQFQEAMAKSDAANGRLREQLAQVEQECNSLHHKVSADRQESSRLQARLELARSKHEDTKLGFARMETAVQGMQQRVADLRAEWRNAQEQVRAKINAEQGLLREMRSCQSTIDRLQVSHEQEEKIQRRQQVADQLRGAFPDGVLGRVNELLLPMPRRFSVALQTCMGSRADAFVVTTSEVARQCVHYLKEKRLAPEIFLPADRMGTTQQADRTHALTTAHKKGRWLAKKCVKANEKFLERHPRWQAEGPGIIDKAVRSLLTGHIITEDLNTARDVAYRDARQHNLEPVVVTVPGELILPGGNMSVRCSDARTQVEFGGADQLEELRAAAKKKATLEKDLANLREALRKCRHEEVAAREEVEEQESLVKVDVARLTTREAEEREEAKALQALEATGRGLSEKLAKAESQSVEGERHRDRLELELAQVGQRYFERLDRELGLRDELRVLFMKEQQERRRHAQDRERLEAMQVDLDQQERELTMRMQIDRRLVSLKEERTELQQKNLAAKSSILAEEETLARTRELEATAAVRLKELAAEKRECDEKVARCDDEIKGCNARAHDLAQDLRKIGTKLKADLLAWAYTFRAGSNELAAGVPLGRGEADAIDALLASEVDVDDRSVQELESIYDSIEVDLEGIPEDKRGVAGDATAEVEREYDAQVEALRQELEDINPNLAAAQHCEAEAGRLKEARKDAEAAMVESKQLGRELAKVRAERSRRFMACFRHVEAVVNNCYKELTSRQFGEGGSAYLDLDDAEEPYKGGVTYTACPPGKRFFPLQQLSGGERSMASMALLFAMHSYRPPPFMVLDEVDAPFDLQNTQALVEYCKKVDFQCVVISLKDAFFSHSDALCGVYKDREAQSSGVVTLLLRELAAEDAPDALDVD